MSSPGTASPVGFDQAVGAGLAAGGLAALAAALVSLTVTSPDAGVANTATISVVALLVGIAAGVGWQLAGDRVMTSRARAVWGTAGGVLTLAILALFDAVSLDGLLGYGSVPAVVGFTVIAGTTPWYGRPATPGWVRNLTITVAVVAGAFLASAS